MNVRKPVDYSAMFAVLDTLMAANLPQMELYCGIGRLVNGRPEKGAAVAAAEYLCAAYPDASGFSPRNLRRMREFYHTYESIPEVLAEAMTIGWTQNVVIMEAELTPQEQAWYIKAAGQFGWSKLELVGNIRERIHESMALDNTADPCYSNGSGGDEDGKEKTSGAFLQGLRDAEVQRKLQRQRSCGAYLQSLFPPLTSAAGGGDDAPPFRKSTAAPPERERDDVAEKSNPRPQARREVPGLYGLCAAISPPGAKPEKAGAVHPNAEAEHQWRYLRSLWRPGVHQRELPSQPDIVGCCPHPAGWHISDSVTAAQNPGKAPEVDGTHAGDFLVERGLLRPCRC
ncbi:DUF1016 N-terminal domain-containing protein [Anaerotruncus sp. 1XD42-93]|uniref:DUF1016 N-terminal domain-containing protein n=1 Tax=Anaerotruncus sp. 1XD42-93 TaxID=2320853 RepID=UPI0013142922|nr:DUF1016 N-terminal domain-containing protein [Anaerotruncus sp. 1XD42-93]